MDKRRIRHNRRLAWILPSSGIQVFIPGQKNMTSRDLPPYPAISRNAVEI